MPATLQDAITWLVTTIENDSQIQALGVTSAYMYSAPEKGVTSYPYVILGKQAGTHTPTICGMAYDVHYLAIKCVDRNRDGGERARSVMERVRDLVEFQTATLSSGKILSILPNNSYEYDEQESGNNNFFHSVIVEKVTLGD